MSAATSLPSTARTVLVVGAGGTVGSEVVRALRERGVAVRALVRPSSHTTLIEGIGRAYGNLADRAALVRALEGVDAAFYVSPHEADEEALAQTFLEAVKAAGTRRVVFVGVHLDVATRIARAAKRAAFGLLFPHYRPKFRLSETMRRMHEDLVILMASNFYQNDEIVLAPLHGGRYVLPIGSKGINRVDVRDIGDAAARALLGEVPPGAYPVVGPATLTGSDCARTWSEALGAEVRYVEDEAEYDRCARATIRGKKLDDFLASFRFLKRMHIPTSETDLAATTALLGRPPTPYADYVRHVARRLRAHMPSEA